MTNQDDNNNSDKPLELDLVLESPVNSEPELAKGSSVGPLFADDSMAIAAVKLMVAESLLKSVTRDQSFSDFMRDVLLLVMKAVKSEAGSILEVDYNRSCMFFRSVVGTSSDRVSSFTIPLGQGIVGHVAESRRPLVVSNVAENKLHLKAIAEAVGFETRNLVAVPILVRGKVFGVLELLNRIGENDYTLEDTDLLTYLCDMAAKAIEARLMIAWSRQKEAA